jgi:hypothetical protein
MARKGKSNLGGKQSRKAFATARRLSAKVGRTLGASR